MRRLQIILIISWMAFSSCSHGVKDTVSWRPERPRLNQTVVINYFQGSGEALLESSTEIKLIYQLFDSAADTTRIIPMKKLGKRWVAEVMPAANVCLLSFKFEDNLNRVDDNSGRGWSIFYENDDHKVARNAHYYQGQIYLSAIRSEAFPYYRQAIVEFDEELKLYPDNHKAWLGKWKAEASLNSDMKRNIMVQYDKLITEYPDDCELREVGFWVSRQILEDTTKAKLYLDAIRSKCTSWHNLAEMEYAYIFMKNYDDEHGLMAALSNFIDSFPSSDLVESASFRLGNLYLEQRNDRQAEVLFSEMNRRGTTNTAIDLALASIKIKKGEFESAEKLLNDREHSCSAEQLWVHPGKRSMQTNLDLCQLYSTRASLHHANGKLTASIADRKRVLERGTPFPAYEWVQIGDAYLTLGDQDSAEIAYIHAFVQSPDQQEIMERLYGIYSASVTGTQKQADFEKFVDELLRQEFETKAVIAPSFESQSLDGDGVNLTDLRGKIVVMTFWDPWCQSCTREFNQLNALVDEFRDRSDVVFLAITGEHRTVIERYLQGDQFKFKQLYDGRSIKDSYEIFGYPAHVIIDGNQLLRYKYVGYDVHIKLKLSRSIYNLISEREIVS